MSFNMLQPDDEQDVDDPYVQEVPVEDFTEAIKEASREDNHGEE